MTPGFDDKEATKPANPIPDLRQSIIFASFFGSGAAALIYELTWSRQLVHILGASLISVTAVLSLVMAGLAAGAYGAGLTSRIGNPIKGYALLQLLIGISALLSTAVFAHPLWSYLMLKLPGTGPLVSGMVISLGIFLPNCFMGATLPVLSRYLSQSTRQGEQDASFLYTSNTTGAVIGTICGGFVLLPNFGLTTSIIFAAAINFTIFGILISTASYWSCSNLEGSAEIPEPNAIATDAAGSASQAALLGLLFISGASVMMLEVAWSRFFSLILGSTTYALAAVLACFLSGQALGLWLASRFYQRWKSPLLVLSGVLFCSCAYIYTALWYYNLLPAAFIFLQKEAVHKWGTGLFLSSMLARITITVVLAFIPALLLGSIFPLALAAAKLSAQGLASKLGKFYAANTCGAIAGSWLAGFCLIPNWVFFSGSGIQSTLLLVSALLLYLSAAAAGCFFHRRIGNWSLLSAFLISALIIATGVHYPPPWNKQLMSAGIALMAPGATGQSSELIFYREGLNTTVTVERNQKHNLTLLKNDGKVEAAVTYDQAKPSPTSSMETQILLGDLPLLLHPDTCRRAFIVGYGSGTTTGSMLNWPELKEIVVAELERAVLSADSCFQPANNSPLDKKWQPRVHPLVTDGRNYLYTHAERFDVIVCQPSDPWVSGASDIFTREFWQLGKERLNANGVFCQWIQLYSITPEYLGVLCRTFQSVFPETLLIHPPGAGEVLLIGKTSPWRISEQKLQKRLGQPAVRQDLLRIGIRRPETLLNMIMQGPSEFRDFGLLLARQSGDFRLNTDDNLLTEYALPQQLLEASSASHENLQAIASHPINLQRLLIHDAQPTAQSLTRQMHQQQGALCAQQGKFTQALDEFKQAAAADTLAPEPLASQAFIYVRLENWSNAEHYLRAALALDPTDFAWRFRLAKILCRNNQTSAGLLQLVQASQQQPENPAPYLYATCWFVKHHNWGLAWENLKRYRQRAPQDSQTDLLASVILHHLRNQAAAYESLTANPQSDGTNNPNWQAYISEVLQP